jgi:hypothetical protein
MMLYKANADMSPVAIEDAELKHNLTESVPVCLFALRGFHDTSFRPVRYCERSVSSLC